MASTVIKRYERLLSPAWAAGVCRWNRLMNRPLQPERAKVLRYKARGRWLKVDALTKAFRDNPAASPEDRIVIRYCDGVILEGKAVLLAIRDCGRAVDGVVEYVDDGDCDIPATPDSPEFEPKPAAIEAVEPAPPGPEAPELIDYELGLRLFSREADEPARLRAAAAAAFGVEPEQLGPMIAVGERELVGAMLSFPVDRFAFQFVAAANTDLDGREVFP